MKRFSKLVLSLCLPFIIFVQVSGKNEALISINENDLKALVNFLSSDLLQGRQLGAVITGLDIAAEYDTFKDEISTLDFSKMKVVTQLAFRVGYAVSDKPERIVVDKPLESN